MTHTSSGRTLALISAPGSRGDVNPMLALAAGLRQQGWTVHVALSEPYARFVTEIDCIPEVMVSTEDFEAMLARPELWQQIKGTRVIFQEAVPGFSRAWFKRIQEIAPPDGSLFIAHPLDLASCVYKLAHPQSRLIHVHLAPSTILNPNCPPKLTGMRHELRWPSWLVRFSLMLGDRWVIQRAIRPLLEELHELAKIPIEHRTLTEWWSVGDAQVGLFPNWFGPPQHFVPNLHMLGFPFNDGVESPEDQRIVADLLRGFEAPPIVFTPGTAHRHARQYFQIAADACVALNRPGLLLSSQRDQFPDKLPDNVRTAGYVPFSSLLPHCAALVHHGGVGTTSQAFMAGIPHVVVPMGFDQFDNGERIEKLGCGLACPMGKLSKRRLVAMLLTLLQTKEYTDRARELAKRCDRTSAVRNALTLISNLK